MCICVYVTELRIEQCESTQPPISYAMVLYFYILPKEEIIEKRKQRGKECILVFAVIIIWCVNINPHSLYLDWERGERR